MTFECLNGIEISNIKASFKLETPVEFDYVEDRCQQLSGKLGIVWYHTKPNIFTIRFSGRTFILFKRSSTKNTQHCNITKCRYPCDIVEGIQKILFLIGQPPKVIDYTIDTISCVGNLGQEIPLDLVYSNIRSAYIFYQPEKCRALEIRCPPFISESRKDSLCCLLYPSGKCPIFGGNNLSEIQAFFDWIKSTVTEKCPALASTMLS